MQGKFVSSKYMLRNVISKLGLREVPDLPFYDMIIWIGEALSHIGSYTALQEAKKMVKVVNYIGQWPLDMCNVVRITDHPRFTSKRTGFTVGIESGEVEVIYDRFPLDEEGFPLVPNDPSTGDAIVWYIAQYLAVQNKLLNKSLSVEYCRSRWNWYCGQARAEGYTPSIDQWERMVNNFYRLIPERQEYANYFVGLNSPEDLSLDPLNKYPQN